MGRKRKRSRGWGKGEGEGRREGRRALEMVKCEKLQLLIVTTLPNLSLPWLQGGYLFLQEMTCSQKHGGNLLDLFYKEPTRWAYTFQVRHTLTLVTMEGR